MTELLLLFHIVTIADQIYVSVPTFMGQVVYTFIKSIFNKTMTKPTVLSEVKYFCLY